jgi:alpha-N-arabinofuranosidase
MYGTLYDPSSPLANADGFRTDHINAARELQITNMRWPGGNYMSGYNWQDGIGPKDLRPMRKDIAWGGFDPNQVGTDEWIALNKAIGSENVMCINLGLGTIDNARYWIEYTNVKKGTYYSNLRAKYGHTEPYKVKYWCIGNELDGAPWIIGHKTIDEYCTLGLEAAKALKAVDDSIHLIANGSSYYEPTGSWTDWNRRVIKTFTGIADYLSIHRYWREGSPEERRGDYWCFVGESAKDFEEKITVTQALVNVEKAIYPEKKPLHLAFDEWSGGGGSIMGVMANSMCFNSFIRHADFVKRANYTMLTGLLSTDRKTGKTYKSPVFYAFKLFSTNCRGKSLDTFVQCGTFDAGRFSKIPYLDVTSVLAKDGKTIFINVVNRHKENAITADITTAGLEAFASKGIARSIEGKLDETYTIDKVNEYAPKEGNVNVKNNKITYSFPAHSLTQIEIKVK